MFKIIKFNCCGLDVHKTWIYACIGITDAAFRTEYQGALGVLNHSVRYDQAQSLTAAQKTRALNNIGAAPANVADDAVKVTIQTFQDEQKAQARGNIGAISQTELDAAQAAQTAAVGLVANDLSNGSGVFGMAMAHDGRANNENEYQAVRYQIYERRRTDQDFAALSGRDGAIVMDGKAVIDGTVTSTMQTQTGNFSNSVRLNFTAASLGVAAPAQSSSTVLSTVICGALPSYRYTTSNGNIISSDTVIGSGETPAETYNQKVFSGFSTTQFFFLVPTMFRIGGTDASPVYLATGSTLAEKKDDVVAYLKDHPVTVYYQTAGLADAQAVYVAVPALEAAEVQDGVDENAADIAALQAALTADEAKLNRPDYTALFHNCVCIGDSLTRGYYSAYASGERNRDYGYPSALSRLTRLNVYNYGLSGADPGEWLGNAQMSAQTYSGFDLALVEFGQNIDIPGESGVNYTESEYQELYLSVIRMLKTANEHMTIFCLSNPGPRAVNGWIQNIVTAASAQYSGVYYLDITTDAPYTAYRGSDNVHLTTLGYMLLGQTVYDRLNAFVASNPTEFVDLYTTNNLPSISPVKVDAD